jgi:hypothetical protein
MGGKPRRNNCLRIALLSHGFDPELYTPEVPNRQVTIWPEPILDGRVAGYSRLNAFLIG